MYAHGNDPILRGKLVKGNSSETCWSEGLEWERREEFNAQGGSGLVLAKNRVVPS